MQAAIRIFNPFGLRLFPSLDVEQPAPRDPGAAREAFESMISGHPGCQCETGAQMLMAMYPDQV